MHQQLKFFQNRYENEYKLQKYKKSKLRLQKYCQKEYTRKNNKEILSVVIFHL